MTIITKQVIEELREKHSQFISEREKEFWTPGNFLDWLVQSTVSHTTTKQQLREIIAHKLDDLILEVDPKRITRQRMDKLAYEYSDKILHVFTTSLQPNTESLQLSNTEKSVLQETNLPNQSKLLDKDNLTNLAYSISGETNCTCRLDISELI